MGGVDAMSHKLNSDKTAAVSLEAEWLPIDSSTPRGVKMLLISVKYGIAQISIYAPGDKYFTHWHPLPRFQKETK